MGRFVRMCVGEPTTVRFLFMIGAAVVMMASYKQGQVATLEDRVRIFCVVCLS